MKRYIILGILFTVIGVLNAQDRIASLRNNLLHDDTHSVLVVSHRADWRNAPENSLQASQEICFCISANSS